MPLRGLFKEIFMNIIEKFVDYVRSAKHELTKVTWPNKQTTTRYSILVVTVSIIVAIFFGLLDFGLTEVVNVTMIQRAQETRSTNQQMPIVPTTVPFDEDSAVQADFDFGNIEFDTDDPNAQVDFEVLPIE
jgi:preprotein translocase subunit SecE